MVPKEAVNKETINEFLNTLINELSLIKFVKLLKVKLISYGQLLIKGIINITRKMLNSQTKIKIEPIAQIIFLII